MNQGTRPKSASLSVFHANLTLLASMIAILVGSFAMVGWPTYRMLSVREVLFILLPACLVLLTLKLPATKRWRVLRVHWPGRRIAAMGVLIGAGGWLVDSWLGVVLFDLLGYTTPLPPDFFPTTPLQALASLVTLAILAPICEETLFRGVIQRGYEELSPRAGILAGGALFALFHQSLPQGLALLPLAFILGYLVWRSNSLISGVIAHATNNALAGALIVAATADPAVAPWIGTPIAAMVGGALVVVGLWAVRRWTLAPPVIAAIKTPVNRDVRFWAVRLWPLLLILPIAMFSIGLEATLGWFPEALAMGQQVRWTSPPWDGPRTWTYELRNVLEEPIGQAECTLDLMTNEYVLACSRQQSAYEADTGGSVYIGENLEEQFAARWQLPGLRLVSFDRRTQITTKEGTTLSRVSRITVGEDAVEVTLLEADGTPETERYPLKAPTSPLAPGHTPQPTVLGYNEWPWRLSALPLGDFYSALATMVDPGAPDGGVDVPPESIYVVVYGAEPIKSPAGTYVAWQVRVGDELTAWYDVERPHTLVALDDGKETWVLTSTE